MVVAANRGYMDILMALLESQLFSPPSFALTAAAAAGHDSIVAILLAQSNVPVDPLALSASAGAGHLPVVRRLLANRHVRSMDAASLAPAIREACLHGRLDVARCLTEHGIADPIALTNAITRGHTEIVRYLLAQRRRATATTDGEEEGWRGVGVEYAPRKQDWVAAKSKPEIRRLLSGASGRQMWFENLMRTVLRRRGRGSAAL
ncbi:hypothetical protein HK101_000973 [Irineochytrium annulatum]|nr:hypothetical protein HK101_000973 [Irineochytrium annulatum]